MREKFPHYNSGFRVNLQLGVLQDKETIKMRQHRAENTFQVSQNQVLLSTDMPNHHAMLEIDTPHGYNGLFRLLTRCTGSTFQSLQRGRNTQAFPEITTMQRTSIQASGYI